jgi:hypothetical protein
MVKCFSITRAPAPREGGSDAERVVNIRRDAEGRGGRDGAQVGFRRRRRMADTVRENDAGIKRCARAGLPDGVRAARAPARSVMPVDNRTGLFAAACAWQRRSCCRWSHLQRGTSGSSMRRCRRRTAWTLELTPPWRRRALAAACPRPTARSDTRWARRAAGGTDQTLRRQSGISPPGPGRGRGAGGSSASRHRPRGFAISATTHTS